jgi:deoxyribodipyrimidine photolyase
LLRGACRRAEPSRAIDQVAAALKEIGVASQSVAGDLLVAPSDIRTKEHRGLRVFTPFWRRVQAPGDPPLPAPKALCQVPDLASGATPLDLKRAGVGLGKTYPEPIVDHKAGRERALAAYAKVRAA